MAETVIVRSKVKECAEGFSVSGDFVDSLNDKVKELIKAACARAEANNRKTVMAKDL